MAEHFVVGAYSILAAAGDVAQALGEGGLLMGPGLQG
jgi:hypothetical protein